MTGHPLTCSNVMITPAQALSRSSQNPYELLFNEYDGCIYLNGSRFISNYVVSDLRNRATAILAPNIYYVVSPNTQITLDPLDGIINEFVIEASGPVVFSQNILWQGQSAPNFQSGVVQYSITYNAVSQQYLGSWALYDQQQTVQGVQGFEGMQGIEGVQGVQGVSGIQGTPVTLTVRVNPSGTIVNEWVTKTFLVLDEVQGA